MFFLLSKLLWMATAPVTLILIAVLLGIVLTGTRAARAGRRIAVSGVLLLLVIGLLPVGSLILRVLEDRFPALPATIDPPTGIIVLGGSTDQAMSAARGQVSIVEAAGRLTEAVILSRRFPHARIVFTGGSSALAGITATEAADARRLWTELGIAPERITTEDRSRSTDENARFTKALLDPAPGERWILVTSAYHMPRAVGLFQANGFPVIPDPVDYRSLGTQADFHLNPDLAAGFLRFNMAVHEWIGLLAYAASGKIATVFPGP